MTGSARHRSALPKSSARTAKDPAELAAPLTRPTFPAPRRHAAALRSASPPPPLHPDLSALVMPDLGAGAEAAPDLAPPSSRPTPRASHSCFGPSGRLSGRIRRSLRSCLRSTMPAASDMPTFRPRRNALAGNFTAPKRDSLTPPPQLAQPSPSALTEAWPPCPTVQSMHRPRPPQAA